MGQQRPRPAGLADAVVAMVLLLLSSAINFAYLSNFILVSEDVDRAAVAFIFGLLQVAALIWRRRHPVWSAVAVGTFAVGHYAVGVAFLPSDVAVLIALYSITVYGTSRSSQVAIAAAFFGAFMQGAAPIIGIGGQPFSLSDRAIMFVFVFGGCLALALAAWGLGLVRRAQLMQQESWAERATRLEHERDQQAQLATQAERTRIAREMHDIVAHSLSVVIAQADGGRYAARADPDAAARALLTISETGRAALADMRRILGILRTEQGNRAELVPQPSNADIRSLVASVRDTRPVSLVEMGTPRPLPPGIGTTLHRLAQEALTNVIKHAGPQASATVMLNWHPGHVVLQIDDDGRGAASRSTDSGHGVLGMRERATMLGGTLSAGPRSGGGYRVRAEIPIPVAASEETQ